MDDQTLCRAALGQVASLGQLYDARTDTFTGFSMFNSTIPREAITETDNHFSDIQIVCKDTFTEKCNKLNVNAELQVSVLAGLCKLSGSGRYLSDQKSSARCIRSSLIYKVKTKEETLNVNMRNNHLQEILSIETLQDGKATHVVVGISWGANSMITCEYNNTEQRDLKEVEGNLSAELQKLSISIKGKANVDFEETNTNNGFNYSIKVLGDVLPQNQELPTTCEEALNLMRTMPNLLANCNSGKGNPLSYKLLPISVLRNYLKFSIAADCVIQSLEEASLLRVVHVFEKISKVQQDINDFCVDSQRYKVCILPQDLSEIISLEQKFAIQECKFRSNLASVLRSIRSGMTDVSNLEDFLQASQSRSLFSLDAFESNLQSWMSVTETISFAKTLIANGVNYIGNGVCFDTEIIKEFDKKTFVLYFQKEAKAKDPETWKETRQLFFQEIKKEVNANFFVVDCDIHPKLWPKEETILIQVLQSGQVLTESLLAEHQVSGTSAWTQCTIFPERITVKPNKRVDLKIPCIGRNCTNNLDHEWFCWKCKQNIEYGFDNCFYCSCGRAATTTFEFKCPGKNHGIGFEKAKQKYLDEILSNLQAMPVRDLNILILGETGVGKSTWINGFYNFLKFKNLDEALKNGQLWSLIPTEFTQFDDNFQPIVVKTAATGAENNEVQVTGQSATQKCQTYLLDFKDVRVRIIDTPGIGDTRGYEQDKINFQNILSTISHHSDLHGICILLKPNNSRLTVMFHFCIKELLTHLHRDACRNIVFCFTNTRGTRYRPGDTYAPLCKLLAENKDVEIPLSRHTVYCYDSEAFRFLAACKNNPPVNFSDDERKDFSMSWNKSFEETIRMIEHIKTLKPHPIHNTISLNRSRDLVLKLTRPLAEIRQSIRTQQDVLKDHIEEIKRTRANTDDLKKRAKYMEPQLKIIEIDHPKTVCTNSNCKEYYGATNAIKYTNPCHNPCYLQGVTRDVVGHEGLVVCDAITDNYCRHAKCGHHYREHMHVYFDTEEYMKEVEDEAIKKLLNSRLSDEQKKKKMISIEEEKLEEYNNEFRQIQKATAEFACFLKANAITPYNDAMSEYLQHQIREERGKVAMGGDRRKLSNLESDLETYEENVRILEENMNGNHGTVNSLSPAKVEETVKALYALKHNGKKLKEALAAVLSSQLNEAVYHEITGNSVPSATGYNIASRMKAAASNAMSVFRK